MKKEFLVLVMFIFSLSIVNAGEYEVDNNTVALWHFNEGSGGTVLDESSNNIIGNIQGPTWTTSGKYGNALEFDGENDIISNFNPNSPLDLTDQVTLEAWVNRNSFEDGMVISKNGPYYLTVRDNKVEGGIYTGTWEQIRGTNFVGVNEWNHIAMTYDGSMIRVYLNGELDASIPKTGTMPFTGQGLNIGWGAPGQNQFFNGTIDEVRISNIARTSFDTPLNDADGDGILDDVDNCVFTANLWQGDQDNDGVGDWCDNCILTSNANQVDSDGNGLGDACENTQYWCRARTSVDFSPETGNSFSSFSNRIFG